MKHYNAIKGQVQTNKLGFEFEFDSEKEVKETNKGIYFLTIT